MNSQEKWVIYEEEGHYYFTNCLICGKEINISPYLEKKARIHVNIAQNPQKKYFCSDTCKLKFSTLN